MQDQEEVTVSVRLAATHDKKLVTIVLECDQAMELDDIEWALVEYINSMNTEKGLLS